ncbi:MAG: RidA family protein [Bacteroidetes bacterium]|nr:RidA family protein [Bacteroidota bacterium]
MIRLLAIMLLTIILLSSCSNKVQTHIQKEFLHAGPGYSRAVVITNGNTKTIYVAGLTGDGEDFETQTRATFNNIKTELEGAGATLKDVVKMNTYIVNYKPELIDIFRKVRKEIMGEKEMPASTVVGVPALAAKDKMIEIEAIAIIEINKK